LRRSPDHKQGGGAVKSARTRRALDSLLRPLVSFDMVKGWPISYLGNSLRGTTMFVVKWVKRFDDKNPVEVEESILTDLDQVVSASKERLYGMRLRFTTSPPDGFVVSDENGRELRRWFGPIAPHA
jgi:hypothetical protein